MKTRQTKVQNEEELTKHIFQLESKLFKTTDSYKLIEQYSSGRIFNLKEYRRLHCDVFSAYLKLTRTIWDACPHFTPDDVIFCCLIKLGLSNSEICCCIGCLNKQTINQRKYRVKKKMLEEERNDLFDLIFL